MAYEKVQNQNYILYSDCTQNKDFLLQSFYVNTKLFHPRLILINILLSWNPRNFLRLFTNNLGEVQVFNISYLPPIALNRELHTYIR